MKLADLAKKYREEARQMLRCADLNLAERGDSFYAQRAVTCAKLADALETVMAENPTA